MPHASAGRVRHPEACMLPGQREAHGGRPVVTVLTGDSHTSCLRLRRMQQNKGGGGCGL